MKIFTVKYYSKRFYAIQTGIVISFIITGLSYWLLIYNQNINYKTNNAPYFLVKLIPNWPYIFGGLWLIILLLHMMGTASEGFNILLTKGKYKATPKISLSLLISAAILFYILFSLPIFFFGGSQNSFFGSMLITLCGLTVIITNSKIIRMILALLGLLIYIIGTFFYIPITILNKSAYDWIYVGAMILVVAGTIFLSWPNQNIFDRENSNEEEIDDIKDQKSNNSSQFPPAI